MQGDMQTKTRVPSGREERVEKERSGAVCGGGEGRVVDVMSHEMV